MTTPVTLLGIVGGSASGKTCLAEEIARQNAHAGTYVLSEDDYYVDAGNMPGFDPNRFNFDEPAAKDHDLLLAHLEALKAGQAVQAPLYDFTTHCRRPETVSIAPRETILLEGILVACRADLRALIDRLIFVATDVALRRSRRIHRDQHERGRDLASIERFWARAEDTFMGWGALAEEVADLVVDGSEDVEAMTRIVVDYLSHNPDH